MPLSHDIPRRFLHIGVCDNVLRVVGSILEIHIQVQQLGVSLHDGHQSLPVEKLCLTIELLPSVLEGEVGVSRSRGWRGDLLGLLEEAAESEDVLDFLRRHEPRG